MKLDPNSDIFSSRVTGLCKDCMVLYAQADLAWKNGTKADISGGVYSHHILMVDIGHPMVDMPIISRCADGSRGGFDFGRKGKISKPGPSQPGCLDCPIHLMVPILNIR